MSVSAYWDDFGIRGGSAASSFCRIDANNEVRGFTRGGLTNRSRDVNTLESSDLGSMVGRDRCGVEKLCRTGGDGMDGATTSMGRGTGLVTATGLWLAVKDFSSGC